MTALAHSHATSRAGLGLPWVFVLGAAVGGVGELYQRLSALL
jgi:hypothetical protein